MKIAIIGGGFYGCYFAKKLKEKFKSKIKIDIFEKNNNILNEAGKNNQYRLHLGFHYPRSIKTIKQTIEGSKIFVKEFKKFIDIPKENIYLIHKNSKINFKKYLDIYKKYKVKYRKLDLKKLSFLNDHNDFQGAINTKEGVILIEKLLPFLRKKIKLNCKIINNTKIINVDEKKGFLLDNNKKQYKNYNFIINTTYTEPNIGIYNFYKIKYELAALIKVKNPYKRKIGLTIMDGPYVSLYPCNEYYSTISSVLYTPIKKFKKVENLRIFEEKLSNKSKNKVKIQIINHAKKFFNFTISSQDYSKFIMSPKAKVFKDDKDQRTTNIKKSKKLISIMCGKLDAAPIIWKKINQIIN